MTTVTIDVPYKVQVELFTNVPSPLMSTGQMGIIVCAPALTHLDEW